MIFRLTPAYEARADSFTFLSAITLYNLSYLTVMYTSITNHIQATMYHDIVTFSICFLWEAGRLRQAGKKGSWRARYSSARQDP